MTSARLKQCIDELTARFPFITISEIGKSRLGCPIYALTLGRGKKSVLVNAAHHANEWITANLAMQFLEECAAAENTTWMNETILHMIPMVNPDGVDLVTGALAVALCQNGYTEVAVDADEHSSPLRVGEHCVLPHLLPPLYGCPNTSQITNNEPFPSGWKANILGVDLNSNYPAGWAQAKRHKFERGYTKPGPRDYVGAFPLCEPESAAMAAYTIANDFAYTISLHTQGEVIFWQYQDYDPSGAKALAQRLSAASGYELEDVPDTSSHAGYRDWFIEKFNRPGMTIECGLGENPLPLSDFADIYKKVAPLLWEAIFFQP